MSSILTINPDVDLLAIKDKYNIKQHKSSYFGEQLSKFTELVANISLDDFEHRNIADKKTLLTNCIKECYGNRGHIQNAYAEFYIMRPGVFTIFICMPRDNQPTDVLGWIELKEGLDLSELI